MLVWALLIAAQASPAAEEKKEEKKKPEPPSIAVVIPLGIVPGATNHLKIRGRNLTNVTELRFTGTNLGAEIVIRSKGKVEVPKEMDSKKVGDTQLEVDLRLAESTPPGTNTFTLVSPDGESPPHPLLVAEAGSLTMEKEPNGGFREAQAIRLPARIQGAIQEAKDVDVFRFHGSAGERIVAEVLAARFGSPLDSSLTLYDQRGSVIAGNDDGDSGADSYLEAKLPADGEYFLNLFDAQDRGGAIQVYQLTISVAR